MTLGAAGQELPDNAMMRRRPEGGALKDASRALKEGTALPIGGHKGAGLAMAIECLTGLLSGGPFAAQLSDVGGNPGKRENISQLVLVLSPEVFMPLDSYKRRAADFIAYIKNSPRLQGVKEILIPGERAAHCMDERMEKGIPLPADVLESLDSVAKQAGLKPLSAI